MLRSTLLLEPTTMWLLLFAGIFCNVAAMVAMKHAQGLSRIVPMVMVLAFYIVALACISLAMKGLGLTVVYVTWSGLGTLMVALIGGFFFRETLTPVQLISALIMMIGIIGMTLGGPKTPTQSVQNPSSSVQHVMDAQRA